jgi:hypothetical protein
MRIETAISLIGVVMEALVHRETCLRGIQRDLPEELLTAALATLEADGRDTSATREWLSNHGVHPMPSAQAPYHRRANNQINDQAEALIRDLLDRGWTKTAIARQLKVNRRVVIRVALEAESAQQRRRLTG